MIRLIPELGLYACVGEGCECAVETYQIERHLQSVHGFSNEEAKDTGKTAMAVIAEGNAEVMKARRQRYEFEETGPVPAIQILAIKNECLKCPVCSFVACSFDTYRRHKNRNHRKEKCPGAGRKPVLCKGQTLFKGKKTRYFEVVGNASAVVGTDRDVVFDVMDDMEKEGRGEREEDVTRMDGFVAEMRFDHCLEKHGLQMGEAFELARWRDCEEHSTLRRLTNKYIRRAFKESMDNAYIQGHKFLDGKLKLAVQEETLKKYEGRISRLISFIVEVFKWEDSAVREVLPGNLVLDVQRMKERLASMEGSMFLLHRILWTLFFEEFGRNQDGIPVFVACASIFGDRSGEKYRYGKASDISPMLAALKYLAKCVAVNDVYLFHCESKEESWRRISRGTSEHADTGIIFVEFCLNRAHGILSAEGGHIRFMVCPHHTQCGLVDGIELSLPELGEKMKGVQSLAWEVLNNSILCGLKVPESFYQECENLEDNFLDRTPGYWFGKHVKNEKFCEEWRRAIVNKGGRAQLFRSGGIPKQKECMEFLDACEELQQYMSVLVQVCCGGPARATEATVMQICNTSHATRNIFFGKGELFFVTSYTKSRSLRNGAGKVLVRFPDVGSSKIMLCYLIIVRPLENTIVELMSDQEGEGGSGRKHRNFMFASRGNGVSAEVLRRWFENGMKKVGIDYGTNQYRHFYTGAVKHFLGAKDDYRDGGAIPFHEQAGHAESTAHRIYGVSSLDMSNVSGEEMEGFRKSSKCWIRALGLTCSGDEVMETGEERSAEVPSTGPLELFKKLEYRLLKVETLVSKVLSVLEEHGGGVKKRGHEDGGEEEGRRKMQKLIAVEGLKKLLRDNNARYKSSEQMFAVEMGLAGNRDGMVVLGTGGGKSLAFMVPAVVMENKLCIVIVPFAALIEDLMRRCSEAGIQCAKWGDRGTVGTRIVFASVEHITSRGYATFVREKSALGQLHCIFLDEAHVVLSSKEYRNVMKYVCKRIRPEGVEVSLIALSATVPPQLEEEIGRKCGMGTWETVRSTTSRENIRYSVRTIPVKESTQEAMELELAWEVSRIVGGMEGVSHLIVYVQKREECKRYSQVLSLLFREATLKSKRFSYLAKCFSYHAGMDVEERRINQTGWEEGSSVPHIMVATNAFGCGIDIGTVRGVIHMGRPESLMDYVQESGRGGRDGRTAEAVLLDCGPWKGERNESFGDMERFITAEGGCRRCCLDRFCDGVEESLHCSDRQFLSCDMCEKRGDGSVEVGVGAGVKEGGNNEGSTNSSQNGRDVRSHERDELGDIRTPVLRTSSASKESEGRLGTPSFPTPSRSTRYSETVTASDLKLIAGKLKDMCPVCSISQKKEVRHGRNSERLVKVCYRGRCLRCGLKGHSAKGCTYIPRESDGTCFQCTIGLYEGSCVHSDGTFGNRGCCIKSILVLGLVAWERVEIRRCLQSEIPELKEVLDTEDYSRWLRGRSGQMGEDGMEVVGIGIVAPWIYERLMEGCLTS